MKPSRIIFAFDFFFEFPENYKGQCVLDAVFRCSSSLRSRNQPDSTVYLVNGGMEKARQCDYNGKSDEKLRGRGSIFIPSSTGAELNKPLAFPGKRVAAAVALPGTTPGDYPNRRAHTFVGGCP